MIGRLRNVVLDAPDIQRLSSFYGSLTGWPTTYADEEWVALTTPDKQRICFQLAPDHVPPQWPDPDHPQQFHLDLLTPDLEAAAARAVELGATRLADADYGDAAWITLADPAGHPFDLCRRAESGDGVTAPMGLYAVTIDTDEPEALGRFYGELLGLEQQYEGDPGVLIGGDDGSVMFQRVARYTAPQWPDPAHPQQFHLDATVDDVDAAEQLVLGLGATRLPGEGGNWRVYADPSGHPFCLVYDERPSTA
jgi:catechol-2,3-dioxygenase